MTTDGETYSVTVNGRVYETGTSRTDASGAVRRSEVTPDTRTIHDRRPGVPPVVTGPLRAVTDPG
jgi:hypothetical protein